MLVGCVVFFWLGLCRWCCIGTLLCAVEALPSFCFAVRTGGRKKVGFESCMSGCSNGWDELVN